MTECVEWNGARHGSGYGLKRQGGKVVRVHRLAWEEANGPIPEGLHVLHRCDNPPCYNVEHLFLGTAADNARDKAAKGRHWESKKAECPQGHPYDEANTYRYDGERHCRACRRERARKRREV